MMADKGSMNSLLSRSKFSSEEIKKLGLQVWTTSGGFMGMRSIIDQLTPQLAGMTLQQRLAAEKMLFGATAGRELDAVIMAGAFLLRQLAKKKGEKKSTTRGRVKNKQDLHQQPHPLSPNHPRILA